MIAEPIGPERSGGSPADVLAPPTGWVRVAVAALVGMAVAAGCGGGSSEISTAPGDGGRAGAPTLDDAPATVLAITTPADASSTTLGRIDAETLAPQAGGFDLGEYHGGWAVSPNRQRLAVGTFLRTGVRFVDPVKLTSYRDVPLPVAAVAVGWISADRVAVLLQRGGVLLIDAAKGTILRRWPIAYRVPCERRRQAVTPHGVIFVVSTDAGAVRMVRVDPRGHLRVVSLPRVRTPSRSQTCASSAFAVDPSGHRAIVAGTTGPLAEVDLRSPAVRYLDSPTLRRALGQVDTCRSSRGCTGRRVAVWPSARTLMVGGVKFAGRRGTAPTETPVGVSVIDPMTWSARRLDRSATDMAATTDGTLITFGGRRRGLRATSPDGGLRWHALDEEQIRTVTVAGGRVYALGEGPGAYVVDAVTGTVIASPSTPLARLDVLSGRTNAGDAPTSSPP